MSVTYQWQRCDSSGGSCANITSATGATYSPVTADVGSTLRVVATDGVSPVTSTQTAVVSGTAPPTFYMNEHLAGALTNPAFWYWSPVVGGPSDPNWAKHFAWISDAPSGLGLRITAPACSSPGILSDGTNLGLGSSQSGQLVGLESNVTSLQIPYVHCGWLSGDPSTYNGVGKHEEVWYRWKQRWPTGFRPTLGTQNSTFEWHFDRGSEHVMPPSPPRAVSPLILVESDNSGTSAPVGGVAFDTAPSTLSRVLFQFGGGGTSESGIGARTEIISGAAFQFNHWYDFVCHWIFDVNASIGYCQLWVDGVLKVDSHRSTSYLRPNGSWGYQEDVGMYNYRHWANFASSVDYDEIIWGPTQASVGF